MKNPSQIQRYSVVTPDPYDMAEDNNGTWVMWEDMLGLLEELRKDIKTLVDLSLQLPTKSS